MLKAAFLIALAGLSSASPLWHDHEITQAPFSGPTAGAGAKVNVTLYVMSRCPDAVCPECDCGRSALISIETLRKCIRRCIPDERVE